MIIAHISDFHLASGYLVQNRIDTVKTLRAGIDRLLRLVPLPDVVIATGDLVSHGEVEDYRVLRRMLDRLPMPYFLAPGNHDRTDTLRAVFGDLDFFPTDGPFVNYVVDDFPLRLVGLDSTMDSEIPGTVCADRLDWLACCLAARPDTPTVLFMHHPPFKTGIGFMDRRPVAGRSELAEVLARHDQLVKILCGHLHRHVEVSFAGVPAVTAPSLAFQMDLCLNPDLPSAYILEPAAFLVHLWESEAGLITHPCVVGDYDGPHPFTKSRPAPV